MGNQGEDDRMFKKNNKKVRICNMGILTMI